MRLKLFASLAFCLVTGSSILSAQPAVPAPLSEQTAKGFIIRYPDPDVIYWRKPEDRFSWQAGYIMFAMEKMWRSTNDPVYFNYIKRFVDQNVKEDGSVPTFRPTALDNFVSGYACLFMYEQTGDERYAKAAETIRRGFDNYPRHESGMFLHSHSIRQIWVDGVFMGQIFLARYAKTMNHPEDFAEVVKQMKGVVALCGKDNGLFCHGYTDKGRSPEVWSEGFGWTAVLFADIFDFLPENQEGRDELMADLKKMCKGLKDCQDSRTGMWCQVVDKPYEEGNWNETSGTGMYMYLIQKAINDGYIPAEEYQSVVDKAYEGISKKAVANCDGFINLIDCSSIGIKRSYQEYISQPHEISTFAAYGSFIIGTGIVEHSLGHFHPQPFYATDYSQGKIFRFEKGRIVWEHDAPLSNDLQWLSNGDILFTTGNGVLELDPSGNKVFEYTSKNHIFACQRLGNGNTFVGESESGRLLEISPKGKIVHSVCILPKGKKDGGMPFMRNAIVLDNGHYLVARYGEGKVSEYDRKGREVWSVDTPGGAHSVIRMPDGNTIVSVADATKNPRIVVFNPDKETVWELSNDDLAGKPLRFMSGMQYVEGEGLYITNWQGHRGTATQPHILLVTKDKKVRAVLSPMQGVTTISNIYATQDN